MLCARQSVGEPSVVDERMTPRRRRAALGCDALPPAGPGPGQEWHAPKQRSHGLECSVLPALPAPTLPLKFAPRSRLLRQTRGPTSPAAWRAPTSFTTSVTSLGT